MRSTACNSHGTFRSLRLAATLLALAAPALSSSPPDGLRLAGEGRCAEALPLLGDAPSDPAAQRARALCLLQEASYAAAARALAQVESADPSVATDLGVARFHAGDLAGAEDALLRAQRRGDARAELPLYLGLIALERAEAAEAAARLEGAAIGSSDPFAPAAAFYAGVARARSGDAAAAREALERVARDWPETAWATEARRAVVALADPRAAFASLRLGFEHDSNVVLRGQGVVLPEEMPGQADQRLFWRAAGGRSWQPSRSTEVGAALVFSGWLHGDLTDFDILNPSLTLWADRRLGERTLLRGLAAYAHAWVGGDDFLSEPSFALELHHAWAERGATRAFVELVPDDYRFASPETDPAAGVAAAQPRDPLALRAKSLDRGRVRLHPPRGGTLCELEPKPLMGSPTSRKEPRMRVWLLPLLALAAPALADVPPGAPLAPAGTCAGEEPDLARGPSSTETLSEPAPAPLSVVHLVPMSVSSGASAASFAPPTPSAFSGPGACDNPGSGCMAERIVDDPDPGTGCGFPGSACP